MANAWSKSRKAVKGRVFALMGFAAIVLAGTYAQLPKLDPINALGQSFVYTYQVISFYVTQKPALVDLFRQIHLTGITPAMTLTIGGVLFVLLGIFVLTFATQSQEYGDVSWAGPSDVKAQELRAETGEVLGKFNGRVLRPEGHRHVVTIAPNRAGKTRGIVLPSIFDYPGSMVAISTRDELPRIAGAAMRAKGPVHIIDFASPDSPAKWSFCSLDNLPKESHALERQAARDAAMFFPDEAGGGDPFWQKTARRFATALFHFEYLEAQRENRNASIPGLLTRLRRAQIATEQAAPADPKKKDGKFDDPFGDALRKIVAEADHYGYPGRIGEELVEWSHMDFKQRATHLGTIATGLTVLTFETVQNTMSRSDFSFEQLRREPCTVFLIFPQSDKEAYGSLTSLFFDNLIAYALDHYPDNGYPTPIKIMFDEFASLKRIPHLLDLATTGAGNAITYNIILQSIDSLQATYQEQGASVILDNATYKVCLGTPNAKTQQYLSGLIGDRTREKKTTSGKFVAHMASTLTQASEAAKLVKPEWWGTIPFGQHVVLTERHYDRPIFADATFWDQNRRWKKQAS